MAVRTDSDWSEKTGYVPRTKLATESAIASFLHGIGEPGRERDSSNGYHQNVSPMLCNARKVAMKAWKTTYSS